MLALQDTFDREIKPILDKRQWEFRAGNGTYGIYDKDGLVFCDRQATEIDLMLSEDITEYTQPIGSLLKDYTPSGL